MIDEKYMDSISIIAIILSLIFMISAIFITLNKEITNKEVSNIETVLDKNSIMNINIEIKDSDWEWLLENATEEEYRSANITINGETFYNVGIRPKGNSSLKMVASDSTTDRFSLKIDFSQYVDGQTYHGIEKLALNNNISDTTYMKEYLSYDLYKLLDVPTPEYSYSNIKLNGSEWGLYLAVEVIDGRFIEKQFATSEGNLYKPESMEMGGEKEGNINQGHIANGDIPNKSQVMQEPLNKNKLDGYENEQQFYIDKTDDKYGKHTQVDKEQKYNMMVNKPKGKGTNGGANLKYIDDNQSSYSTIKDSKIFKKTTDQDFEKIITMIKNLNQGKDLEKYLDVKEILAYFAVNTFLVNLDSYSGGMYHNYYLYENKGKCSIIPWDLNMSFAGFKVSDSSKAVNFPIDTPVTGSLEEAPLIGKLLQIDEYKEIYHNYLQKIVNDYVYNGEFEKSVNFLDKLIGNYVKKDPTAFYTYEEYKKSIPQLLIFGKDRSKSVTAQLKGEQNSDTYGNIITTLNLDALGSMGTGDKEKSESEQKHNNKNTKINKENISKINKIINGADIKDLTSAQKEELEKLGVDETVLNMFKNKDQAMDKGKLPGDIENKDEEFSQGVNSFNLANKIILVASIVALIAGLIFSKRFKRKNRTY
ncbi:CotH kinase family protein [Clostridium rectalis]|uniref:CotH kinase family protein n=1 Tax=Clostridium rectalis TaxID=2040295 RepID=UPI000F62F65B|nr:CotH kinase family protein [Clostridium rectalis]